MTRPPRVLVVDDDDLIVAGLTRGLKREGYEVEGLGALSGLLQRASDWAPDVILLDIGLPDGSGLDALRDLRERGVESEVVMLTADDTAATAMKAVRLGAADYLTKPFDLNVVRSLLRKLMERRSLKREVDYLRRITAKRRGRECVGSSPQILEVRRQAENLAAAQVPTVLITGESGTGKELVARYIHSLTCGGDESPETPFVAINCAALAPSLIESELFGHEKGAFTDAKGEKKGVFELADGGSLLLDEIGEMPLGLQTRLLRVLEERTIRRVGGKRDIAFAATVIAATNRDLASLVERGEFRSDLYYRLNGFSIDVPPLRERGQDVLEIASFFLLRFAERYNKRNLEGFTRDAEAALLAYGWPGNVRELRNVVERLVVLEVAGEGGARRVGVEHLPREVLATPRRAEGLAPTPSPAPPPGGEGLSLEEVKRNMIVAALEKANHNRAEAARVLKVSYDTLRYQMKKYGLE